MDEFIQYHILLLKKYPRRYLKISDWNYIFSQNIPSYNVYVIFYDKEILIVILNGEIFFIVYDSMIMYINLWPNWTMMKFN